MLEWRGVCAVVVVRGAGGGGGGSISMKACEEMVGENRVQGSMG